MQKEEKNSWLEEDDPLLDYITKTFHSRKDILWSRQNDENSPANIEFFKQSAFRTTRLNDDHVDTGDSMKLESCPTLPDCNGNIYTADREDSDPHLKEMFDGPSDTVTFRLVDLTEETNRSDQDNKASSVVGNVPKSTKNDGRDAEAYGGGEVLNNCDMETVMDEQYKGEVRDVAVKEADSQTDILKSPMTVGEGCIVDRFDLREDDQKNDAGRGGDTSDAEKHLAFSPEIEDRMGEDTLLEKNHPASTELEGSIGEEDTVLLHLATLLEIEEANRNENTSDAEKHLATSPEIEDSIVEEDNLPEEKQQEDTSLLKNHQNISQEIETPIEEEEDTSNLQNHHTTSPEIKDGHGEEDTSSLQNHHTTSPEIKDGNGEEDTSNFQNDLATSPGGVEGDAEEVDLNISSSAVRFRSDIGPEQDPETSGWRACRVLLPRIKMHARVAKLSPESTFFICPECQMIVTRKKSLQRHLAICASRSDSRIKRRQKWRQCAYCNKVLMRIVEYRRHLRTVHKSKAVSVYTCSRCSQTFCYLAELTRHVAKKHQHVGEQHHNGPQPQARRGVVVTQYVCSECQAVFTDRLVFYQHRKTHRGWNSLHPCCHCDMLFTVGRSLRKHVAQKHRGMSANLCFECGANFEAYGTMRLHRRETHWKTKAEQFKCKVCQRKLNNRSKLETHMRTHTGQKPFLCSLCGAGFAQLGTLNGHLRWHKKEKNLLCHICNKLFGSRSNLNAHLRLHALPPARPVYKCSECCQEFSAKRNLKRHLRSHLPPMQYKCQKCSSIFSKKKDLFEHVKTVHVVKKKPVIVRVKPTKHRQPYVPPVKHKNYLCDKCHMGFESMDHFKRHISKRIKCRMISV